MDKLINYIVRSPLLLNGTHYTPGAEVQLSRAQAASLMSSGVIEPKPDLIPDTPPAAKGSTKGKQAPHQVALASTPQGDNA